MKTQIWIADFVPELVPEWVSPFQTVDYDKYGKRYFIFEIDVDAEVFVRCKTPDKKAMSIMKVCGIIHPKRIYQGLRSEIFLNESENYPPSLSSLMIAKI
jgi:hypothetical protein